MSGNETPPNVNKFFKPISEVTNRIDWSPNDPVFALTIISENRRYQVRVPYSMFQDEANALKEIDNSLKRLKLPLLSEQEKDEISIEGKKLYELRLAGNRVKTADDFR